MKYLLFILISICCYPNSIDACSMYKITRDGKTIVGNNEDWISPNNQLWFEPAEKGGYGVMNVGLLDNFAQGAINSAGLMFDGFAGAYLPVNNTEGKIKIPIGEAVSYIMHNYATVKEVKVYMSTIDLSPIASGHLVFVDKTGEYLIAEGDELILGNEPEKAFSNFYYSQIKSVEEVELPNFKNGLKFLNESKAKRSLDYCGSVMNNLSNPEGFTQYSSIYDLEKLTIRIYLYHDYTTFVELDLKKELKKGKHQIMLASLFSEASIGYQHYMKYNDLENPTRYVEEIVPLYSKTKSEEELAKNGYSFNLNWIGYEWLYQKNEVKGAIAIFKYGLALMPNDGNLYDSLGEAYYVDKNYEAAIKSYAHALMLNPENDNAIEMLNTISKNKKED